jgi:hypothetical protein
VVVADCVSITNRHQRHLGTDLGEKTTDCSLDWFARAGFETGRHEFEQHSSDAYRLSTDDEHCESKSEDGQFTHFLFENNEFDYSYICRFSTKLIENKLLSERLPTELV